MNGHVIAYLEYKVMLREARLELEDDFEFTGDDVWDEFMYRLTIECLSAEEDGEIFYDIED